jgi:rhamnosyl/mannosyltransferase
MRIVHVYKDYYPVLGGIENHVKTLAEAQASLGHDVTALVCNPSFRTRVLEMNGVRVYKAGRLTTLASMPISVRQPLALLRMRPDVLHVQSPYPLGEMSAWLLKRRAPLVISYQSDIVRQHRWLQLYGPLLQRVLSHADRILVNSPRYLETSPWLQPVKAHCKVVPLSVDHQRFHPPAMPYAGPPVLLFVGRLRYYKGLDTLLRALPELPPEVTVRVVGTGEMREPWERLAGELGISERVHFAGDVSDADLPSEYQQASLFVLPANARSEAFGIVLLEAMASGLPCITTDVGTGTSWVVQDGVTGRVVPTEDPQALRGAIADLLSDAEQRQHFGRAARARVEAEFTQDALVSRVMRVYAAVR